MKKYVFSIVLSFLIFQINNAQKRETFYLQDGEKESNYYIIIEPNNDIKTILLVLPGYGYSPEMFLEEINLDELTPDKNILLVVATPKGKYTTYLENESIKMIDEIVGDVIKRKSIKSKMDLVVGGFSIGGNGAMLYSQFIVKKLSMNKVELKGLFVVDSPIDLERFWYSAKNTVKRNYHPGAVKEAEQFIGFMTQYLNGSPENDRSNYLNTSPFISTDKKGGNAIVLKNTPIKLFTEPDETWWKQNRGAEYEDLNAIDLDRFTALLKSFSNTQIELIKTENKGYRKDGRRHPHSWSIVDEDGLIKWIKNISPN
jgi:predicted esterase